MSHSKIPSIIAQRGEKMNFTTENSRSTLIWIIGVASKMLAT
jgi:hypothetical protein